MTTINKENLAITNDSSTTISGINIENSLSFNTTDTTLRMNIIRGEKI